MVNAQERLANIHNVAERFYGHLKTVSGVVLSAEVRYSIVGEAQQCLVGCEGCNKLPQTSCLSPNAPLFAVLEKLNHTVAWEPLNSLSIDEKSKSLLVNVVHTIVNHQGRVDQVWYDTVIDGILQTKNILPDNSKSHQQKLWWAHVAYQEIAALCMIANSLNIAEMLLSSKGLYPFPSLPTNNLWKESELKPAPLLMDYSSLLKTGDSIRQDPKQGFGPIIYRKDLNKKSPEFSRLSARAWKKAVDFMYPMNPMFGLTLAGEDVYFVGEIPEQFYLNGNDVLACLTIQLDPNKYCSTSFSRRDSELIAYQEKQRQTALKELAQAIANRPFSLERANEACNRIEKDYGVETCIEAVAVAAAFELSTKGADMTGKSPIPGVMLKVMYMVLRAIRYILSLFAPLQG